MISNEELWLSLLKARNIVSYTYSDEQSLLVIKNLKEKYIDAFDNLKKTLDEKWLTDNTGASSHEI